MNKLMIGVVGGALMLTAGVAVARPMHAAQGPQIWEQAHVPPAHTTKGEPVADEEVAGVETFTPVAFQNCTVAAGNHFQQDVTQAQANQS